MLQLRVAFAPLFFDLLHHVYMLQERQHYQHTLDTVLKLVVKLVAILLAKDDSGCLSQLHCLLCPDNHLTVVLSRMLIKPFSLCVLHELERVIRFELTTFWLATKCSTPELHPHPWDGI